MCALMTEIQTIEGGQKNVCLRRANIKKYIKINATKACDANTPQQKMSNYETLQLNTQLYSEGTNKNIGSEFDIYELFVIGD